MERADAPGGDVLDRGREDDGEERGDVDDEQLAEQKPGDEQQNRYAEAEEDVAADGAAGGCCFGGGGFGEVVQRGAPLLDVMRSKCTSVDSGSDLSLGCS